MRSRKGHGGVEKNPRDRVARLMGMEDPTDLGMVLFLVEIVNRNMENHWPPEEVLLLMREL